MAHRLDRHSAQPFGAFALGAVAVGAFALGALAIGALAIGRLAVGKARIRSLEIGDLSVRRVHGPEPPRRKAIAAAARPARISPSRPLHANNG